MKTFKNIKTFEKKLHKSLCWEDYFKLEGKIFKIFEYGDISNNQFVYFYNKRSEMMIKINYICPSYEYINGIRIQKKEYSFLGLEYENYPKNCLWRTDTL